MGRRRRFPLRLFCRCMQCVLVGGRRYVSLARWVRLVGGGGSSCSVVVVAIGVDPYAS